MHYDEELDSSGFHCPIPILNLTKFMRKMESGKIVKFISDDTACDKNVSIFVRRHKYKLLASDFDGNKYIFYIQKG